MARIKLGKQIFRKGDKIRLSLNPNNITGVVIQIDVITETGARVVKIRLDNGIEFDVFSDEIEKVKEK